MAKDIFLIWVGFVIGVVVEYKWPSKHFLFKARTSRSA